MHHTTAFVTPVVEHWLEREIGLLMRKDIFGRRDVVEFHPRIIYIFKEPRRRYNGGVHPSLERVEVFLFVGVVVCLFVCLVCLFCFDLLLFVCLLLLLLLLLLFGLWVVFVFVLVVVVLCVCVCVGGGGGCVCVLVVVGRKEMFYLTTHLTHFIYGYMASYIF